MTSKSTSSSGASKENMEINKKRSVDDEGNLQVGQVQKARKMIDTGNLESQMGESWHQALESEFSKTYFMQLKSFLASQRKGGKVIFPPENEVYSWTRYCTIDDVKVVIIGQDPYHNHNQAHGLCFSVRKGVAVPPSLKNIYKELASDIEGFKVPAHGCLTGWAQQGVLLLNAVLTVEAHKANAHQGKGWERFTDAVIRVLSLKYPHLVYMLWGNYAAKKAAGIDDGSNCILKAPHPSPLSAHRGFLGCRHFSRANDYLKANGKAEIDWTFVSID
eukprot:Partr_v1_DN23985_c0_g1_i3_m49077 putative Excises uracil residues from the DNA which can arise as a result of misincorporation of dUMP residues by DNA polymerase or due to deamination of cytosine (By similarity)